MSIAGIASTALFSLLSNVQGAHNNSNQGNFQQIEAEFNQLGQDLQSGNLAQAQQDYATLSQNFPTGSQAGSAASSNPITQAFNALSQDLQNGNLSAAQQDYSTVQQDLQQQQNTSQVHHHHHHGGDGQQSGQIQQAFSSLAQELQSGNISGAQSAFATLEQDMQQFNPYSDSAASVTGSSSSTGTGLSVTA
jgi:outer membrane protein assembly factor BamD (BamD/ComL family)